MLRAQVATLLLAGVPLLTCVCLADLSSEQPHVQRYTAVVASLAVFVVEQHLVCRSISSCTLFSTVLSSELLSSEVLSCCSSWCFKGRFRCDFLFHANSSNEFVSLVLLF